MLIPKKGIIVVAVFLLVLSILGHANAKSLYLVANHHTAQFDAWNINPDGTTVYQATYWLSHATDPGGIAIDESSNTLFLTSEFSGGVEMVNATTMTSIGVSLGPSNLAGIDVDDANDIVYTIRRYSNNLYAYDWDPSAKTLTPRTGFNPYALPGCSNAYGLALDVTTDILWVADCSGGTCRAYDVNTWTEDTSKSFSPSHGPVDIDIDKRRDLVYTVGGWHGSTLLSKYDLATRTETTFDMAFRGCGIAVDEATGLVYITAYGGPDNLSVWNCSTYPFAELQTTVDLGNPAGLCIPEEAGYNILGLNKDDGLADDECVHPGDTITYTISFDNTLNTIDIHNVVIVDDLPPETTFVSASDGGTYDLSTHMVTWDIGTLPAGAPTDYVTLVVTVNLGITVPIQIVNYATINAAEPGTGPTTKFVRTWVCLPTIESCDSTGTKKDSFDPSDTVYANGDGYCPSTTYDLYVVPDTMWTDGMAIPGTSISVSSDSLGNIPPTAVMSSPLTPGKYDIVVDVNGNGVYDADIDALDDNDIQVTGGFLVIPEYWLGTILGLVGCFAAFGVFRVSKRKRL